MAYGWRCDIGCETWPDKVLYKQCPICGSSCSRFSNLTPLSDDEAEPFLKEALKEKREKIASAKRHKDFQEFYAKHCNTIGIPVEGLLTVEQVAIIDNHS